ncbi:MAG: UDP-N-acetylglucosamine--N-acetylmuramyl-(pentapeptide) pyrophosphoryl-undecaprenol N-acetylglucosamine transferase, partial [Candidatus Omnitrophica bacterium]|nr:UDP-N-acetylglucosamine--N-acetylmuramyl-(pentapeptide) pyrophosphoryl-undecaprenol N-acetylglucosamine transferase [Candidatus Omnitrophota bacterium]
LPKRESIRQIFSQDYKSKFIYALKARPFSLINFLKSCLQSLFLVFEFKPDVVVGFGGIDSIPLLMLAWFSHTKTLIHEQNVIPGKANRLLAKFADKIAVSFKETEEYLGAERKKLVLTGNPLRQQLTRIEKHTALIFFEFSANKFTILVMGGSQGAHKINTVFLEVLKSFSGGDRLQIIHICGNKDYDFLAKEYKKLNLNVKLFSFLKEIWYAYSAADLAVCRAGATTIAELIFFKLPAIIIPYPFAEAHQKQNAEVLEKRGSAVVVDEQNLSVGLLRQVLEDILNREQVLRRMQQGYVNFPEIHAGKLLSEQCKNIITS